MNRLVAAVLAGGILLLLPAWGWFKPTPINLWTLTDTHADQPVVVSTNARFGAAVYSITWGGFQFVDATDHGRQCQTAWSMNNQGEGENPTEAGSAEDGAGANSSTQILSAVVNGKLLMTSVKPAYWLVFNGLRTSPHTLNKVVTLNGNLLRFQYTMTLVGNHVNMAVEGITCYMPQSFVRAFTIENGAHKELPYSAWAGSGTNNVILTTVDTSRAIGCKHSNPSYSTGYGWIGPWPKIDCAWFHVANAVDGTYAWEASVAVGTLDQVVKTLASAAD